MVTAVPGVTDVAASGDCPVTSSAALPPRRSGRKPARCTASAACPPVRPRRSGTVTVSCAGGDPDGDGELDGTPTTSPMSPTGKAWTSTVPSGDGYWLTTVSSGLIESP